MIVEVYALKEGLRQGITNYYYKNGKVKKKEIYKNGELQKDGLSKFWNIFVILAFGIPFLILPFSFFKIHKQFPKVKLLDEYQKEKILEILVKYNSQIISLHSSYSINGTGTTYVKIRDFKIREEKISILAKMYSAFWMPMPYIIGYIVCRDKDKIISSFSKESFQKIKDEIQAKILWGK